MELLKAIEKALVKIEKNANPSMWMQSEILYNDGDCQILSQSAAQFHFLVSAGDSTSDGGTSEVVIGIGSDGVYPMHGNKAVDWDAGSLACLKVMRDELKKLEPREQTEHKKYTREGMIKRVLKERMDKALKARYRIDWAANKYGDHLLTNEKGVKYKLFLRDFVNQTGYSDSMDAKTNKLGTTKHLMFAFNLLTNKPNLLRGMRDQCPFVEIYLDPLNDYKISWFYPHPLPLFAQSLISRYFGKANFVEDERIPEFINFPEEVANIPDVLVRPEVIEKIEKFFEDQMLEDLQQNQKADISLVDARLYPYQMEGIQFATFRKAAIIADEMGLGKTLQAIGIALNKKKFFGFEKTLVICPASLKEQWKREIERFTQEKAQIIEGFPDERARLYKESDAFFLLVNYETVLRDQRVINKAGFDFLILDEAQRVKNFATKTAAAVGSLQKKHTLVITGTPIENRLIDIFSIVNVIDTGFLGPLWEFSYQYCLFDPFKHDKINGYYNLQLLKERLQPILLRREKRRVLDQLPNVRQINVPVALTPLQVDYHSSYARGVSIIVRKKFLTPFDLKRLQLLLANMRMVCDSTYLVDKESYDSPKLDELKYLLLEQMDVKNTEQKIIIFSEWVIMLKLIGRMLRESGIGFVELTGSVPVKNRGALIARFEQDPNVKVFLSTEAGGSGLNLQVADTLINFELPWNPAKKNQRIGRIDRIGQKNKHLTIINLISKGSIEERIAAGLQVKQNLFDGVLDTEGSANMVDFSAKGRSQFLEQLEAFIGEYQQPVVEADEDKEKEPALAPGADEIPEEKTGEVVDLSGDESEEGTPVGAGEESQPPASQEKTPETTSQGEELEQVMNNGLQFLSGLFKMSTGKEIGLENQKIEINRETGEVTMKFKLPGLK